MPRIMGDFDVPEGAKCAAPAEFQCDNYEEISNACYVFGQKISGLDKCAECRAACEGN